MAALTVVHIASCILQCPRQCLRSGTVMLQQVKRHALGRLDPHARQAFERLD
jgi:hypothetical protein